jgi:hypothetical protein
MAEVSPFSVPPLSFASLLSGKKDEPEAPAEEPAGKRSFVVKLNKRRFASMQHAEQALALLPEAEGQALFLVQTGFFDLSSLLVKLLEKLNSVCLSLKVGTLSMSRRNIQELIVLYDLGKVKSLALMCADVFRRKDSEIFAEAVLEFQKRGQLIAAHRSHAKVITIALEDQRKFVLLGSANLR